jgi:hypothetical protein
LTWELNLRRRFGGGEREFLAMKRWVSIPVVENGERILQEGKEKLA